MENTFCKLRSERQELGQSREYTTGGKAVPVLQYQSMMLVERAAEKPSMLKLISVAVQRPRPAMTGNRDRFTHSPAYKS